MMIIRRFTTLNFSLAEVNGSGIWIWCPGFDIKRKVLIRSMLWSARTSTQVHDSCCQQVTAEREGFPLSETSQMSVNERHHTVCQAN